VWLEAQPRFGAKLAVGCHKCTFLKNGKRGVETVICRMIEADRQVNRTGNQFAHRNSLDCKIIDEGRRQQGLFKGKLPSAHKLP
jgi:hypothetical protein